MSKKSDGLIKKKGPSKHQQTTDALFLLHHSCAGLLRSTNDKQYISDYGSPK